jgi:hypothetical protein
MTSTLVRHVAIVAETQQLALSQVMKASAAIQKQVSRDFSPLWSISATVDAFEKLEDVPSDSWIVYIRDSIPFDGAAGIHLDKDNQPFALVALSDSWTLTTSHETLEMLADPFGNRLVASASVKPGQDRARYLVEVCDPSEAEQFAYTVNGVTVSDFYTPNFFDPAQSSGVRYSFNGGITGPRQVLDGGYLSWEDVASGVWWQQRKFGGEEFVSLGSLSTGAGIRQPGESLRAAIDRITPSVDSRRQRARQQAAANVQAAPASVKSRAQSLRDEVTALINKYER